MLWTLLALAAASPAAPDPLVGRYTLVGEHGRIVCRLRIRYEPTVGGEIDAPAACKPVLPVDDGLRWFAKPDGGYSVRDAVHREVATIANSEGGFILYVGAKHYDLEGPGYVAPPPPTVRAAGIWRVQNDAVPSRLLCRVELRPGGAIGPTLACPATMKPYGGGRWTADEDGIALRGPAGQVKKLSWEDDDDLNGDNLHLAFIREQHK